MQVSASGPGRLCKAFGITRERDNGINFTSPDSDLQIWDDGFKAKKILVSPRIGITKDPDRLARYFLADNRFVSKPPKAFKVPREGNTAFP
jgi:DNA-3-methyladenine glycosylase